MTAKAPAPPLEHKTLSVAGLKVLDAGTGIVECYVAGIGNVDEVKDRFQPGCFVEGFAAVNPKGVWGHDWLTPIAKCLEKREVPAGSDELPERLKDAGAGGVYIKAQFNLDTQRGRDSFSDVQFFGDEQEWSVGYEVKDAKRDAKTGVRDIFKSIIWEFSPVLFGANRSTQTVSAKSLAERVADPNTKQAIVGSWEAQQEELREALMADHVASDDAVDWLWIVATFDDQVVYRIYFRFVEGEDYREPETWRRPYTLGGDGEYSFGAAEAVRIVEQVIPDDTPKAAAPPVETKDDGDPDAPKDGEPDALEAKMVADAERAVEALELAAPLLATKAGKAEARRQARRIRAAIAKLEEVLADTDPPAADIDDGKKMIDPLLLFESKKLALSLEA